MKKQITFISKILDTNKARSRFAVSATEEHLIVTDTYRIAYIVLKGGVLSAIRKKYADKESSTADFYSWVKRMNDELFKSNCHTGVFINDFFYQKKLVEAQYFKTHGFKPDTVYFSFDSSPATYNAEYIADYFRICSKAKNNFANAEISVGKYPPAVLRSDNSNCVYMVMPWALRSDIGETLYTA